MPINIQSDVNWHPIRSSWTNPASFQAKNTWLAQSQDLKGTPLENFLRDLSTNEKPAFWALDQSGASISARFSVLAKSGVYQSNANVPIDWQTSVTGVPMEYQWTTNGMSIDWQSNANWHWIRRQLTSNLMLIDSQSDTSWHLIWCKLTSNWIPIDCQSDANWHPIEIQSYVNWLSI